MTALLQELADEFTRLLAGGGAGDPQPGTLPSTSVDAGDPASPAPVPPGPVQVIDFPSRGWHLDVAVPVERLVSAVELLDRRGLALDAVTGMDWLARQEMEVVYDFFHLEETLRVVVRCRVPRDQPEVPTISAVFAGANWHEREAHEFFGIRFRGHPNLVPLLLPEDADYHPLRKDFVT